MSNTKKRIKEQGAKAFIAGYFLHANPYNQGGWQFKAWMDGWIEAHDNSGGGDAQQ